MKWRCCQSNGRLASPVELTAQLFLELGRAPTKPVADEFRLAHASGRVPLVRGLLLQLGTVGLYGILMEDLENIFKMIIIITF